nr:EAL domain-containing protein [Butyrivibrio sp.]
HEHFVSGKPIFPVSVNFSRLDFIMCDMLKVVENAVAKYDIPRDYIHIEITESMIAQDEELMKDVIESFRNRGYEIWMDDFGSGYSSLTLLQDYDFDLLKMDMHFLTTLSEKSKTIVRSTINMAKRIGIKTLCEGVKTKEQIDFLYSIGCGKFQGFYFGQPEPYDTMLQNMASKNISIEKRSWYSYYEIASITALDLDQPLEIIEYDGNTFKTLFMNDAFRKQISIASNDLRQIDRVIYNPSSALMPKYIQFIEKAIVSKSSESFYYTNNGDYFLLKVLYLSENENRYLFKASITNISLDHNTNERDMLDNRLRELNHLHEVVLLINYKEDIAFPLLGGYLYLNKISENTQNMTELCLDFAANYLFSEDKNEFIKFMRLEKSTKNYYPEEQCFTKKTFRVKQQDGSYKWREFALLPIPGTDDTEFLFTISILSNESVEALDKTFYTDFSSNTATEDTTIEYAQLWYNLITNSTHKMFWKDKNRRFRGVSKAFMDFYEIKSLDDIIGKTDEDMHWHVDDGPYQGDELDVIGKGKVVFNAPGQCIVNGVVHNIICNKIPIYEKGKIIGLVGNFEDIDQEIFRVQKLLNPSRLDKITRLMNSKFFVQTLFDYAEQYHDEGKNYAYILLHNSNHHRIEETYGNRFSSSVLKEISEKIIDIIGQRAVASRIKESYFGILIYIDSNEKLNELIKSLKEHIEEINQVNNKNVTINITAVGHLRSEENIADESLLSLTQKELDSIEAKKKSDTQ